MSDLNVALAVVGGLALVVSLATGLLHSRNDLPTESMIAVGVGAAVGPAGLDLLALSGWGDPLAILEQGARLTVALAVMSIALRLPRDYVLRHVRPLAVLLGPAMLAMWVTSGLLVFLLLDLAFWPAMLVGAAVTPTDPVLASAILVGGTAEENIPPRLRHLLSGEAGANDGLALPFVLLPILVMEHGLGAALPAWLTQALLWEVLGAVALGIALGVAVGRIERWSSEREFLEETSVLTVTVSLTFATLGLVKLLGSDGILAAFVAGLAYGRLADPGDEAEEQGVQEVFNRLFTYPVFVAFGMALPWAEWAALGWAGLAVVVGVLLFRRLPAVYALRSAVAPLDRPAAALFVGWFGPIGIAAVFYATVAVRETGIELVWPVVSLVVAGSVLVHGGTATAATLWYGRLDDEDPA